MGFKRILDECFFATFSGRACEARPLSGYAENIIEGYLSRAPERLYVVRADVSWTLLAQLVCFPTFAFWLLGRSALCLGSLLSLLLANCAGLPSRSGPSKAPSAVLTGGAFRLRSAFRIRTPAGRINRLTARRRQSELLTLPATPARMVVFRCRRVLRSYWTRGAC